MTDPLYPQHPILLVDDERSWLENFAFTLEYSGKINNVLLCQDSREVMDILGRQQISAVVLDLTMPHRGGEELLAEITADFPQLPVLILSGLNQLETAVRCIKAGAFDYFVKTTEAERLVAGVKRALAQREMQDELERLRERMLHGGVDSPEAFADIQTCSPKMRALFSYLEAVSASREPILIRGESGVGKELFARAAHRLACPDGPWVAVNVAGLDDQVFADTLFGHVRGAFTGADQPRRGMVEQAAGGMLFLDEIGDLSLSSQIKLLRFLQEGEYYPLGSDRPRRVQTRLICATNQDLARRQAEGSFRKDLYYRLCAHQLEIPPLRQRQEDICLLLEHFLAEAAAALGKSRPTPPEQLALLLSTYAFPGNVRELRAMVYDALSLHAGGVLSMAAFKRAMSPRDEAAQTAMAPAEKTAPDGVRVQFFDPLPNLEQVGDILVDEALTRAGGNQTIAARLLGISQPALSKRLKKRTGFQNTPS